MQDNTPQPAPPLSATPSPKKHDTNTPKALTIRQRIILFFSIPTATAGTVWLITGNTQDILPSVLIASQAVIMYVSFVLKQLQKDIIITQTIALFLQLYSMHDAYKTYVRLERISTLADSTHNAAEQPFLKQKTEGAIQLSGEEISLALVADLKDKNSHLENLFQERNELVKFYLIEQVKSRLHTERHLPPPPATKAELHARKIRATVFGSLILICVGVYLFTLRTHYRTAYGVIEVGFAALAAATAVAQLLDTEGVSGWLGVGASIYLLVRGLDNVDQGLTKLREQTASAASADTSIPTNLCARPEKQILASVTHLPPAGAESHESTPHPKTTDNPSTQHNTQK